MSDSDQERKERHRRRRRIQSATTVGGKGSSRTAASDDQSASNRYSKRLERRLKKSRLLDDDGLPIVAMQTRHINNRQHPIPFRQQFDEQIAQDRQYIDRQIEAARLKIEEKTDKEKAYLLRRAEEVYAQKVRNLKLFNHRGLVQGLLEEHLNNSTPEGQLRRIQQLEEDYRKLKQEHDQLVKHVNQNETKCNKDKLDHDNELKGINNRFDQYRIEIDEYKRTITQIITDNEVELKELQEKQELLNKKQEEHGISIKDLSLQRDTLNKLSQQIEQIINARRSDLDKLDKFTKRLDDIKDFLNQIREGLRPLDRIPFLEREINEIRNLLIQPSTVKDLELRVSQAQRDIVRHNTDLEQLNGRLDTFDSLYQELRRTIDEIKTNDLTGIQQHLQSIDNDLESKSLQINEASTVAKSAMDQIGELRQSLSIIRDQLSDLEKKILDIENIKSRLNRLETKPDDSRIAQILEEQSKIRAELDDVIDKQRQFKDLADDLEKLKRKVDDLSRTVTGNNEPHQNVTDVLSQSDLEAFLDKAKREIMDSVSNLLQQLNEQINEAKTLINDLKEKLDKVLNAQRQQSDPLTIIQRDVPRQFKRIPYIESLLPVDLFPDIWK